ncbi:MAG: tetratricopeptide repeat protein [Candidatus Gastranaerophilales bacterium]|nr:tetratricopeptide repeat protein [Candidatus Gastranaerophilales bacterium]
MNKKIMLATLVLLLSLNSTFTCGAAVNLEKNIEQINSSIEKANYKGADEVIYRTLTEYKNNYDVQALAAVSWALQSKLELAQDQIDRLKNVIPRNSNLHFAQGVVFYKRINSSNMSYRTKADSLFDIAQREFRYAIQLNPNNYKAYNALGVVELKQGHIDEAKQNIERALNICPNYAIAMDNLGTVYLAEGDVAQAESCFKKAVAMNQNSPAAYYHLAQLECNKGNYAKCLTYINKCLAWQGYSSYAYNLKGDAFRLQGNEAAAISAYKKAIEITPENLAPYANLASIYEVRKDYELALDSYKTILSISPDSEQTLLKIADIYLETGKYNEAVNFYEKLNSNLKAEGVKGMASAYYGLAMNTANKAAFTTDKKLVAASEYLDKAIKENPNDLELYLAKAKISSLINRQCDSVDSLKAIVQKQGCDIDDFLVKGDAYTALGNYKAASAEYDSAINAAKTLDDKAFLGEIFTFNKQFDEAQVILNDLLKYDSSSLIAQNNLAYIKKSRDYANLQAKNANYFRKRNSMFFEREYLNKALKADPYNVDANILMGRLNQRQHKYTSAYNCYAIVVAKSTDCKTVNKYTKRLNSMKKKIDKQYQKSLSKAAKQQPIQVKEPETDKNIVPVANKKTEKVKKEKTQKVKSVKPAKEQQVKQKTVKTKQVKSKTNKKRVKKSSGSTIDYAPKVFDK